MEEFTFPTNSAANQHPFPLCLFPSEQKPVNRRRRTFSSIEERIQFRPESNAVRKDTGLTSPVFSDNDASIRRVEDEERMDMLWEDFNELELHGAQSFEAAIATSGGPSMRTLRHRKRPTLMSVLKVLKKLFVIQRTSIYRKKAITCNGE